MQRDPDRQREIEELASAFMDDLGYDLGAALQLAQRCVRGLLVEAAAHDVIVAMAKASKGRTTNDERRPERG